jgi:hypothetical protein
MENEVTNWKSRLVNYSGRSQKAQTDPFVYQSSFESVESELTKVSFPTALSIFLAIVLQLLLLCPYFIAKRDSLNKGLLISLSKKKAEINSKKPTDIIKKNR